MLELYSIPIVLRILRLDPGDEAQELALQVLLGLKVWGSGVGDWGSGDEAHLNPTHAPRTLTPYTLFPTPYPLPLPPTR